MGNLIPIHSPDYFYNNSGTSVNDPDGEKYRKLLHNAYPKQNYFDRDGNYIPRGAKLAEAGPGAGNKPNKREPGYYDD